MTRRTIVLGALLLLAGTLRAGDDAQDLLRRLQDRYRSVDDAAVTFTQRVVFGVTRAENVFRGTFAMKKGNKYRLELEEQTIVTDGTTLWSYTKATNQLIINAYREDPKSLSPDKVLVSVPQDYVAAIVGPDTAGGRATTVLKLTPKTRRGSLRWMKVWVDRDGDLMRRIQVYDASENTVTYDLGEIVLNGGIPAARFQFTPPAKAGIIDLR